MKRILALALVLCLCVAVPLAGTAQTTADALIISARVVGKQEIAIKAPATGELAPFTVRQGDQVKAGDTLFTVEPQRVYADLDGTIAAVYAQAGDIADAAVERFGAVLCIERVDRYEISANTMTGYNSATNRNLYVGTKVYLRSVNEKHFAEGMITAVSGRSFTVAVIGGDLVYTENVKIYRQEDYDNKTLLGRAGLSSVAPYNISASGTIVEMAVAPGDTVKAGDLLFTYVPDALEPEVRGQKDATVAKAERDLLVSAVNVQAGASVQKDQALLTAYPMDEYQLCGQVEESDLSRVQIGATMRVTFEEIGVKDISATVSSISALGTDEDPSRYQVYFDFETPEGVMIGMHATIE